MADSAVERDIIWNTAQEMGESRIYISGEVVAADYDALAALSITHVAPVGSFLERPFGERGIEYGPLVSVLDMPNEDLLSHFDAGVAFIRSALASSPSARILVHCAHGQSRSATMVAAYLIADHGMSPTEACHFIAQHRPVTEPNQGFLLQLKLYAAIGASTSSPTLPHGPSLLSAYLSGSGPYIYVPPWAHKKKQKAKKSAQPVAQG